MEYLEFIYSNVEALKIHIAQKQTLEHRPITFQALFENIQRAM